MAGLCHAAYYNPGLCTESGPPCGLLLSFGHIPECGATCILLRASQGAQPLQSREPGPGFTPPETLKQGFSRECPWQAKSQVHGSANYLAVSTINCLLFIFLCSLFRPGKSPDRSSRQIENYEPISPPQSYQGMDKQESGVPPTQRREAESEIRYERGSIWSSAY